MKPVAVTAFSRLVPTCSTHAQFKSWSECAKVAKPNPKIGFCEDCTRNYQAQMIRHGLCENPSIRFFKDQNGEEYGAFRPILHQEGPSRLEMLAAA